MAEGGRSWRQILSRYYPAAHLGQRPAGERIRVLLDTTRTVSVGSDRAIAVWTVGGRRIARARRVRVTRPDGGPTNVLVKRDRWRRVARHRGAVVVRPRGAPLWVRGDGERRAYRGRIVVRRRHGRLRVINGVRLEAYLRGVLPAEMPALWPQAALRAQAVAARSYAVRVKHVARAHGSDHDICATTACQLYGGTAVREPGSGRRSIGHPRANAAIRATRRTVLIARGRPVLAEYSSSSGGHTAPSGVPGVRAVRDRADRGSPYHRWRVRVPAGLIRAHWPSVGRIRRVSVIARDGYGAWGGRARRVGIVGERDTRVVPASTFRIALGLRSDYFRLRASRVRYRFTFDMGEGTSHPAVRALQDRLRREGVYPRRAPRTTYFGPITRASLRRYQRAHGIISTGYLGPITRRHLNRDRHHAVRFRFDMGYGTRHPAVLKLQRRLRAEGVYPRGGPFTTYFGPITRASLRRYQRAQGIISTGYLGPITRRHLNP